MRKFEASGSPLTVTEAADAILQNRYLMVDAKPMHPGVLLNWSLATLRGFCSRKAIRHAQYTKEWAALFAEGKTS